MDLALGTGGKISVLAKLHRENQKYVKPRCDEAEEEGKMQKIMAGLCSWVTAQRVILLLLTWLFLFLSPHPLLSIFSVLVAV